MGTQYLSKTQNENSLSFPRSIPCIMFFFNQETNALSLDSYEILLRNSREPGRMRNNAIKSNQQKRKEKQKKMKNKEAKKSKNRKKKQMNMKKKKRIKKIKLNNKKMKKK